MIWLFASLGGLFGLLAFLPEIDGRGLVVGAVVGALVGVAQRLAARVAQLERSLASLRESVARSAVNAVRAVPPQPAQAGAAQASPAQAGAAYSTVAHSTVASAPRAVPAASSASPPSAAESRTVGSREHARPPSLFDTALTVAVRWLTTGNVPVKAGVLLSLFGMGFLIKEGIDRQWLVVPIEARLVLAAVFGLGLLALGWRLRERNRVYALSVQGGGIGMLYLTAYAAFAVFNLLPPALAFALLVLVTAAAGSLAVLQDAKVLALLGIVGGFLAPLLVGSETGSHVLLFCYYAVLNGAIVGVAWFKAWRELNVLGFAFTFVIGSLWGSQGYRPEHFATTEPFLLLFTVLYTIVPILFAHKVRLELRGFVDGTLVFGTPIVAFALQSRLVGDTEYGLAISAAVLAAYYAALAVALRPREAMRPLVESFVALAIAFGTLSVPLALGAGWTSAAWALEGAALIWFGVRQGRTLGVWAGVGMQLLAAVAYAREPGESSLSEWLWLAPAVFNERLLGAVMLALAGFVSSAVLDGVRGFHAGVEPVPNGARPPLELRRRLASALLAWAGAWWLMGGATEIVVQTADAFELAALLAFVAATTLAAMALALRLDWQRMDWLAVAAWPAAFVGIFAVVVEGNAPSANFGALGWGLLLATLYVYLRIREQRWLLVSGFLHVHAYWIVTILMVLEAVRRVADIAAGAWALASGIVTAAFAIAALLVLGRRIDWPLAAHSRAYSGLAAGGVALALATTLVFANFASDGASAPLTYVPLLNPLELAMLGAAIVLWRWTTVAAELVPDWAPSASRRLAVAAGAAWMFVTMAAARAVHHLNDVPFALGELAASSTLQTTLSLIWGLCGCGAMLVGARRGERIVWAVGAGLMAVVFAKLFFVEIQNVGRLGRIVSFLGVGALLLAIGYLAPMPRNGGSRTGAAQPAR